MSENNYYHGPVYPGMRQTIKDQFNVGDVIEVSDLVGDGRDVKGFKKVKILEKWKHFLVAVATDSTPSGVHVRECYAYTDLATVMYTRPCIQF